jgi:tetratricopeptide (TPR) repeat protein
MHGSGEQGALGATACAQLLYLASRMGVPEDEATAIFEEGRAWAEAAEDARLRIAVLQNFSRFRAISLGDGPGALALAEDALRVATEADDREARLFVQALLSTWLYQVGRPRDSFAMAEATLVLAAGDTAAGADLLGYSPYVLALSQRGLGRHALGQVDEGERDAERAVALAAGQPSLDLVGVSHFVAALIAFSRGDAGACTRHALAQLDVAARVGSALWETTGLCTLGGAHLIGENWSEAVATLERALETTRRHRTGLMVGPIILDRLAAAHLGAGETGHARAALDEAIALTEKRGTIGYGYQGSITLARVLLASSGAAARSAIEAALEAAQARVDRFGERVHQPFIHLARADLAAALGDAAGRERELREAQRLFREMGVPIRAEQMARELAG